MKKEKEIEVMSTMLEQLEIKRLQGEIDERVWLAESLKKSSEANTATLQKVKATNMIIDLQVEKAREVLKELREKYKKDK